LLRKKKILDIKKNFGVGGVLLYDTLDKKENLEIEADPMDIIIKSKELLDMGAINEEEFQRLKNKYLDQIIKIFMEI
jgi:hypothetical protein